MVTFKRILRKIANALFRPSPRGRVRWAIFFILIVSFSAAMLDAPSAWNKSADWINAQTQGKPVVSAIKIPYFYNTPFRLGLDLLGGTHLVYEADVTNISEGERDEALTGVRDVIERRVNAFGVAEPVVQTNKAGDKWRVIAELAGVKDVKQAIAMIGKTPLLEFKEQNTETDRALTPDEQKQMDEYNADAKKRANAVLADIRQAGFEVDFKALQDKYSEKKAITLDLGTQAGDITVEGPEDYIDAEENSALFAAAQKTGENRIRNEVVELDDSYTIIKVGERRATDTEVNASHILVCFEGKTGCTNGLTQEQAKQTIDDLKARATPSNFGELAKANSTDPVSGPKGGDLDWFRQGVMIPAFEDAVFALPKGAISDIVETDFGYHLIYQKDQRPIVEYKIDTIVIKKKTAKDILPPPDPWKYTGLTGAQLKRSQVEFDQNTGEPHIALEFNEEGKNLFSDLTVRNVGKPIAVFLDGILLTAPTVQQEIRDGRAVITGSFTIAEAKETVRGLNAGALPIPITLVGQTTIGASLGQESIQKSLFAALIGFLLIALFMTIYYRLPGFLSVIALLIYGALVLAFFKLFGITLTLAGIAGFILSIGMAVDANVLIFERLKEELKNGKPLGGAMDEGFKRAWPSIRDGNLSTLITCFILMIATTSLIKGFAITLAIGVTASMLSAIIVTKYLLKFISHWIKKGFWYGA